MEFLVNSKSIWEVGLPIAFSVMPALKNHYLMSSILPDLPSFPTYIALSNIKRTTSFGMEIVNFVSLYYECNNILSFSSFSAASAEAYEYFQYYYFKNVLCINAHLDQSLI